MLMQHWWKNGQLENSSDILRNTYLRLNLDIHGCVLTKRTKADVNCTSAMTVAAENMKY